MNKEVKIIRVGVGAGMCIPKVAMEMMGIETGEKVAFNYDPKTQKITIKKIKK